MFLKNKYYIESASCYISLLWGRMELRWILSEAHFLVFIKQAGDCFTLFFFFFFLPRSLKIQSSYSATEGSSNCSSGLWVTSLTGNTRDLSGLPTSYIPFMRWGHPTALLHPSLLTALRLRWNIQLKTAASLGPVLFNVFYQWSGCRTQMHSEVCRQH